MTDAIDTSDEIVARARRAAVLRAMREAANAEVLRGWRTGRRFVESHLDD